VKILHLLGTASDEASGPTYSVQRLAREQGQQANEVQLFSQTDAPSAPSAGFTHQTFPVGHGMKRVLHSPQMSAKMRTMSVDVVHNHAMWMAQGLYALAMRRQARSPLLVTSPRGSLAPFAMQHNRWRKRALWPLQHQILAGSDLFHATADHELLDIRRLGYRQPVAVVGNGIDLPEHISPSASQIFGPRRTLLYLGRIHRLKGIDQLLDAWKVVAPAHPEWQLAIAGPLIPTSGYDLEREVSKRGLDRVIIVGPLYGEEKSRAYREAELYVLPSRGENFGITIAEALAQGTPVVACHGAPWRVLEEEKAGWWVPQGATSLATCLDAVLGISTEELAEYGRRGLELVAQEYSWNSLAQKMTTAYRYVLGQVDRPDWVHLA
jgi:glycosyltransferase involved in cell wall biosynthesis